MRRKLAEAPGIRALTVLALAQSSQRHLSLHFNPALKHSQYFLMHFDFLQKQRRWLPSALLRSNLVLKAFGFRLIRASISSYESRT